MKDLEEVGNTVVGIAVGILVGVLIGANIALYFCRG